MKKIVTCFLFLLPLILPFTLYGQTPVYSIEYAVRITATVKETPPAITLKWNSYPGAVSNVVYRKAKKDISFFRIAVLPGKDTTYTDTKNIVADSAYEYEVSRIGGNANADGYIYTGIKLHATDYRGKLLLIVDSTFVDSLSTEIDQLMDDISADGWAVTAHYVSRNAAPPSVKQYIINQYMADSQHVKALFLLGHVPVPYSGDLNPDGHKEHLGSWPADAYYGDIHGLYTDTFINNDTSAGYLFTPSLLNVPGDGKFDQSIIPGTVLLQIGRVDLSSMDSFPHTETQLMQQYLHRDHDYRFRNFAVAQRSLISDNLPTYGEGFGSCGWRNFAPMFSDTGIHTGDYFTTLDTASYLWSYGCGFGGYQGAEGIGSTGDFSRDSVKVIFNMFFGSLFGDWNNEDDFLRAPLASPGLALTSCWAARPMYFFHHMAMGETVGYGVMTTQNNSNNYPYVSGFFGKCVHIALMGDPTLRQHTITPPHNVVYTIPSNGFGVSISWDNSPDSVAGYYVYRSKDRFGEYDRVSPAILTSSPFVDDPSASGSYYYYVKAVKWQHTPSGNYLNTSEGVGGTPVSVITGAADINHQNDAFVIYPNPANDVTSILWQNAPVGNYDVSVKDELGRTIYFDKAKVLSSDFSMPLSLKGFSAGCYYIEASNSANHFVQKLVVSK